MTVTPLTCSGAGRACRARGPTPTASEGRAEAASPIEGQGHGHADRLQPAAPVRAMRVPYRGFLPSTQRKLACQKRKSAACESQDLPLAASAAIRRAENLEQPGRCWPPLRTARYGVMIASRQDSCVPAPTTTTVDPLQRQRHRHVLTCTERHTGR